MVPKKCTFAYGLVSTSRRITVWPWNAARLATVPDVFGIRNATLSWVSLGPLVTMLRDGGISSPGSE